MANTTRRKILLYVFFAFAACALAGPCFIFYGFNNADAADEFLDVFSPPDEAVTSADYVEITGMAKGARQLFINGQNVFPAKDGSFHAAAVLDPGKNLIRISSVTNSGKTLSKRIRVLREASFSDVGPKHWAKETIEKLASLVFIEGYPDGRFEPGKPISRGEIATWIARAKNLAPYPPVRDEFFDVPKEHWRAPYIKTIVDRRIMDPVSKDIFGIDTAITRGEAAKAAVKAEGLKIEKAPGPFGDVPKGAAFSDDVYSAYRGGLMAGVSARVLRLEPARSMTRAEAAALLIKMNVVNALAKELRDFSVGYDELRLCSINVPPVIRALTLYPSEIPPDGRTVLAITAEVFDAQGRIEMPLVRADLRELGGPPDARLYDDGTFGDIKPGDGVFSLAVTIPETVPTGRKKIVVSAMDRFGMEDMGEEYIMVVK